MKPIKLVLGNINILHLLLLVAAILTAAASDDIQGSASTPMTSLAKITKDASPRITEKSGAEIIFGNIFGHIDQEDYIQLTPMPTASGFFSERDLTLKFPR